MTKRSLRGQKESRQIAASKFVPYLTDAVLPAARSYLPAGPDARLTASDVERFRCETASEPAIRMAVLGVLRAHASNGAEVGISVTALMVSVLGFAFSLLNTIARPAGWLTAVPVLEAIAILVFASLVIRAAVAAHLRKMIAVTWLGAYQDVLAETPTTTVRRGRFWSR